VKTENGRFSVLRFHFQFVRNHPFYAYNSSVHKFVRSLITESRRLKLPFADETIIVAVSGGADSLSLLLALDDLRTRKKLDLRIVAAHFNHKLRGRESDADQEFVRQIASERKFELALGHGSVAKEGNLEQNARNARYAFLTETAANLQAGCILTAHTLNDQAETFLLNLIRGSGLDGLSGMRPVREMRQETGDARRETSVRSPLSPLLSPVSSPFLARPLLRWAKREDTENFCRELGVEFRYDTMNEDMSFKRVRIRKMLIPMLKEFNPKIIETLAQTAELMGQAERPESPASARGREAAEKPTTGPEELLIKDLTALESSSLRQTLRFWLKARRGSLRSIGLAHIDAIERLIHSKKSGRTVELPGFGLVRKQNGRLRFENIKVD
jgi:tRNA(Ile)-lysidine synthase